MILIKYTIFAIIAIGVNLFLQFLVINLQSNVESLLVPMLIGTFSGLMTKYILDKKFIFNYVSVNNIDRAQNFLLYSLMGTITSLVFWTTEITFYVIFQHPSAKYLGAFIGLTIGYIIKYFLDKKYVFNPMKKISHV